MKLCHFPWPFLQKKQLRSFTSVLIRLSSDFKATVSWNHDACEYCWRSLAPEDAWLPWVIYILQGFSYWSDSKNRTACTPLFREWQYSTWGLWQCDAFVRINSYVCLCASLSLTLCEFSWIKKGPSFHKNDWREMYFRTNFLVSASECIYIYIYLKSLSLLNYLGKLQPLSNYVSGNYRLSLPMILIPKRLVR